MYGLPIKKIEFQNQHGNDVVLSLDAQVRADISPKDFVFLKFISCDASHWISKAIEQRVTKGNEQLSYNSIELNIPKITDIQICDGHMCLFQIFSSTIIHLPIKNKN